MQRRVGSFLLAAAAVLAASGCQTELMPTPNIYANGAYQLYGNPHDRVFRGGSGSA